MPPAPASFGGSPAAMMSVPYTDRAGPLLASPCVPPVPSQSLLTWTKGPSHPSVHHTRPSTGHRHSCPCCLSQHDAQAAYTAQFIPWSSHDLLTLDVPINRAFRRLLLLPATHPNALLDTSTSDGGLGLPRLSKQVNLRKWSIACRLQEWGGLSSAAVQGLLGRASAASEGSFIRPNQGDFIGRFSLAPV